MPRQCIYILNNGYNIVYDIRYSNNINSIQYRKKTSYYYEGKVEEILEIVDIEGQERSLMKEEMSSEEEGGEAEPIKWRYKKSKWSREQQIG